MALLVCPQLKCSLVERSRQNFPKFLSRKSQKSSRKHVNVMTKRRLTRKNILTGEIGLSQRKSKLEIKFSLSKRRLTLHPPYDPRPFVVTGVNNNAVDMQRDDGTCRKRDKNQIKVVRKRPQNLKPSWQSNRNLPITD